MNNQTNNARIHSLSKGAGENDHKFLTTLLMKLPSIIFELGWTFLRFKRQANIGGKVFYRESVKNGIDKKTANKLTSIYLKGSLIFESIIKNLR